MKAKGHLYSLRFASLLTASVVVLSTTMSPAAHAQAQLNQQNGIADPSRAGDELRQPDLSPQVTPDVSVKEIKPQGVPKGAENIKFKFGGLQFEGVSVYTDAQLKSLYADKIGQTLSLADVYKIANQITLKYRNDGYILTQVVVPPQTIDGGVPKLRVVEGYIENVKIEKQGNTGNVNLDDVKAYASKISHGGPLNAHDLERELLLINDLPGVTARSILSPSEKTAGAADLLIIVDSDPFNGLVSADNFGSRYLGPLQLGAGGSLNSPFGNNEAITGQIVFAPQDWYELAYGSLGYEQPIGPYGTKLHANASVTDTQPGWDLKEFDVQGRSYLLNVGATHPFIRSRSENLTGRVNFDWRRVKSSNLIEDTRRDRISALRVGGRFEFIDTLLGAAANTVDTEISKGLHIFGANEEGDDNMTRADGDPEFTKIEAELQRLQRLTGSVNLLLGARGQYASNALLSSEEFGVGGINSGRGYDPSEVTGDKGLSGKVELQWKDPVKFEQKIIQSYQLYSFYDVGVVWNEDATTSSQKRDSLASVGAGIRFDLPFDVSGGLAIAFPLTRDVQTHNDTDPKVYMNLSKRF